LHQGKDSSFPPGGKALRSDGTPSLVEGSLAEGLEGKKRSLSYKEFGGGVLGEDWSSSSGPAPKKGGGISKKGGDRLPFKSRGLTAQTVLSDYTMGREALFPSRKNSMQKGIFFFRGNNLDYPSKGADKGFSV